MPNKLDRARLLSRRLDELETQISALQQEHASVKSQLSALLQETSPAEPAEEIVPEDSEIQDRDLDLDPDKSSKADLILEMIRKDPHLDYGAAAEAIYGENNAQTYRRVSALLSFLRTQGKIRNVGRARWEIIEASPSARKGRQK